MSDLFSLQGRIYSAQRDPTTGRPFGHIWLGNVSEATLELTTEKSDKFESFSGNRLLYGTLHTSKGVTFNCTIDEFLPESLALGLYGDATTVTGAAVVDELAPAGAVAGTIIQTQFGFVADTPAMVVKDSTVSPVTLVLDTDYEIVSLTSGQIRILDITGHTQPYKVSYTYQDSTRLVMFENATPPQRCIVFDGINTVTGDRLLIELWRMQFDPVTEFGLINEDWGGFGLTGNALYDEINSLDPVLGGFGRIQINKTYGEPEEEVLLAAGGDSRTNIAPPGKASPKQPRQASAA